ncbi:MAG: hypothetical protein Q4B92_08105 [Ruminococcus sp.]|nr:hypothetical protein [Ruminococcus sp.]
MSSNKPKKEKVIYIDDGRTIADMSGLPPRRNWLKKGTTSSFKDIWRTYFSAVKMMIRPMLVVLGFIAAACLIMTLLYLLSKI